jgi:anaerobic selenocysteine-containing dehydrogenase
VFGRPAVALDDVGERIGLDTYGETRSRVGGFPDVIGNLPAALLPREIETPGELQIRALFVSAGNPVLSVPDGSALERAIGALDLFVSLDLYVNETNRHADYVLPATTLYEREDVPLAFLGFFTQPFIQLTEAVVPPPGEARQEWEIIDAIARRIGVAPYSLPALRRLARLGVRLSPRQILDLLIRTGPRGDLFGIRRSGLSQAAPPAPARARARRPDRHRRAEAQAAHPGRRVRLWPPEIAGELERIRSANWSDPDHPLLLMGMRELRSHNSWMHNAPLLMRGGRVQALRVHPDDAAALGLEDGAGARVESKSGAVQVPVKITDEMTPGTVALPHGWGHRGGWRLANEHAGANVNLLSSSDPDDLERLAGMAHLNGIPVRVSPVAAAAPATAPARAAAP